MSGDSPELEALFDSVAQPPAAVAQNKSTSANGDSPELEALFDSAAQAPAMATTAKSVDTNGDSPELEALFDSIATETQPIADATAQDDTAPEVEDLLDSIAGAISREAAPATEAGSSNEHIYAQLGQMTRSLHNLLREFGYDKTIERVASEIPDNRDRLNYIATMTAQAAERTLTAAETAQPIQEKLAVTAKDLGGKWDRLFQKELGVAEFKALVQDTRDYLRHVPSQTEATNGQLMEIIMAQDFQDLTGQVIKKTLEAAQNLENQLISLLVEAAPEEKRVSVRPGLLEGPIISTEVRSDVVASQEQVDELLASLGF